VENDPTFLGTYFNKADGFRTICLPSRNEAVNSARARIENCYVFLGIIGALPVIVYVPSGTSGLPENKYKRSRNR
jgi:hypothetical protein